MTRGSSTEKAWVAFQVYLKKQGQRVTQPRRIICEYVFKNKGHFTADDLVRALSLAGPTRVSRGTIYQTLSLMVRADLLREIRETGRRVYYDRTFGFDDHEHLLCEQCGSFFEFLDPDIHDRITAICRKARFEQRVHRVTVMGTCRSCRQKR